MTRSWLATKGKETSTFLLASTDRRPSASGLSPLSSQMEMSGQAIRNSGSS